MLPKSLRDRVGLVAGPVEVSVVGASLVIEPASTDELRQEEGLLLLATTGQTVTAEQVREARLADQR